MIRAGDSVVNPFTGDTLVFHRTAADTNGEFTRFETILEPDAFVAAAHVHPYQSERFTVVAGALSVKQGRETIELRTGETVVIEPGTPHRFSNGSDEVVRFLCEVRPALQFESRIETMFALAADGKTNRKGMPTPLPLALIANHHFADVRLPVIPHGLQKGRSRWAPRSAARSGSGGATPRCSAGGPARLRLTELAAPASPTRGGFSPAPRVAGRPGR